MTYWGHGTFVVGIPRLNETELLDETLVSIGKSFVKPYSVFVLDNSCSNQRYDSWGLCYSSFIVPQKNLGVAASWNLLHKLASPLPIVLLNADCAVAPDTFEKMFAVPGPAIVCAWGFGCVRIDDEVWKLIGDFDEGFWPAYYEDADYRYRCKLARVPIMEWDFEPRTEISPGRTRSAQGLIHGKEDFGWPGPGRIEDWIEKNKKRYVEKWGGMPTEETFSRPFDGAK